VHCERKMTRRWAMAGGSGWGLGMGLGVRGGREPAGSSCFRCIYHHCIYRQECNTCAKTLRTAGLGCNRVLTTHAAASWPSLAMAFSNSSSALPIFPVGHVSWRGNTCARICQLVHSSILTCALETHCMLQVNRASGLLSFGLHGG
jgi:hypothetical protein